MTTISNDAVTHDILAPHGDISFDIIHDNTFVFEVTGPFREEIISALAKALAQVIEAHPNRKEVVVFNQSCVATEGTFTALKNLLKYYAKNDLSPKAVAYVADKTVEGEVTMMPKFQQCYASTQTPFKHFTSPDQAIDWLNHFS